jgi:hypothetical protein
MPSSKAECGSEAGTRFRLLGIDIASGKTGVICVSYVLSEYFEILQPNFGGNFQIIP